MEFALAYILEPLEPEGSISPQRPDPEDPHQKWPEEISELEESSCASPFPGNQSVAAKEHRVRKAGRHERNRRKFEIACKLDERKEQRGQRRREKKALERSRQTRLGLPSKSSKRAAAKRRREQNFETSTILAGGGQKAPRIQSKETEKRLTPEERMKAFEEAEKAKGHTGRWWERPESDSESEGPTRPARFRPATRKGP